MKLSHSESHSYRAMVVLQTGFLAAERILTSFSVVFGQYGSISSFCLDHVKHITPSEQS